jgi:hypothetical protein
MRTVGLLLVALVGLLPAVVYGHGEHGEELQVSGSVDTPRQGEEVAAGKPLVVRGWVHAHPDYKHVEVWLNRNKKTAWQAKSRMLRADVAKAVPAVKGDKNTGFHCEIPAEHMKVGEHTVLIGLRMPDGSLEGDRTVKVKAVAREHFRGQLDVPADDAVLQNDPMDVSGWVLAETGITGVRLLVDGKVMGDCEYGLPRKDVAAAYPGEEGAGMSGFHFRLNPEAVSKGEHSVVVAAKTGQGMVISMGPKRIYRLPKAPVRKAAVDPLAAEESKGEVDGHKPPDDHSHWHAEDWGLAAVVLALLLGGGWYLRKHGSSKQ